MASRRTRWLLTLTLLQALLLAATYPIPHFGAETWHHIASLAGILLLTLLLGKRLSRSRKLLAINLLIFATLASLSGFYLIYWKAGIRLEGFQDWAVWWHITWSWAAMILFIQHTWINRTAFTHFFKQTLTTRKTTLLHASLYLLVVAALIATWSPSLRGLFVNANYVPLTLWTWVLLLVPTYLAWAYLTHQRRQGNTPLRDRFGHWPIRRLVDLTLVPATALTILSGIPLLFDGPIDPRGLKYVSKFWHVWPSILFTVLVFIHTVQAWPTVKTHWQNLR